MDTDNSRDQRLGGMVDSCLLRARVGCGEGEKTGRGDAMEVGQEPSCQGNIASHHI